MKGQSLLFLLVLHLVLQLINGRVRPQIQRRQVNGFDTLSSFQQQRVNPNGFGKNPSKDLVDESELEVLAAGVTDDLGHEPGEPYSFNYKVNEKDTQFSQKVESDGEVINGEYRVLLPDGRTQIVAYIADWKNGYRANVSYEGTARPYVPKPTVRPDENEEDIQPGGSTPCKRGYFRPPGQSKCRPISGPDENEEDIQPGGSIPVPPTPRPCPGNKYPLGNGKCPPIYESEEDIRPGGYLPSPPTKPCPHKHKRVHTTGRCELIDEQEEDIQPGGYVPEGTTNRPCQSNAPSRGYSNCTPKEKFEPSGYLPTPGPTQPCPIGYMRYEGKGHSNCHKLYTTTATTPTRQTRAPSQSLPKPKPISCPRGQYSPDGLTCRRKMLTGKAKCIDENKKDPRICFPELCYPGSKDPKCKKFVSLPDPVDEEEEDIQAAGGTLKPAKPTNLYNTPDTPFGVRLNRKFGYR